MAKKMYTEGFIAYLNESVFVMKECCVHVFGGP